MCLAFLRGRRSLSQPRLAPLPPCCKHRLVVVGRSTCPFCIEISRTFSEMGLHFVYYQG